MRTFFLPIAMSLVFEFTGVCFSAEPLKIVLPIEDIANCVALSGDGKYAVFGSSSNLASLWDAVTGKMICVFAAHTGDVTSVTISGDAKYVATASRDGTAIIWDSTRDEPKHTLRGHTGEVIATAISKNGKVLITGSLDKTAIIWDVESGKPLRTISDHQSKVSGVAISAAGNVAVTSAGDKRASVWDVATGQKRCILEHDSGQNIHSVSLSDDAGRVLTGEVDDTAILWDGVSGKLLRRFNSTHKLPQELLPLERIKFAELSGNGKRVVLLKGGFADVFNAETGEFIRNVSVMPEGAALLRMIESKGPGVVVRIAISTDGQSLLKVTPGYARAVDLATNRLLVYRCDARPVRFFAPIKDGAEAFMWFQGNCATHWDLFNLMQSQQVDLRPGELLDCMAFSRNGNVAVFGYSDGKAQLFDLKTRHSTKTLKQYADRETGAPKSHRAGVTCAAMTWDGKRAVTASRDKTAILWDCDMGEDLETFVGHKEEIYAVAVNKDGTRVVTGSADAQTILWDADTGKDLHRFAGHTAAITSVALSPDAKTLATASEDKTAILWDLESYQIRHVFQGHTQAITSVAISDDAKYVVTGSGDKIATVWNCATGKRVHRLIAHYGKINGVAWSGSKYIWTASQDCTTRLWDAETGRELCCLFDVLSGNGWLVTTPEGFFDGAEHVLNKLEYRVPNSLQLISSGSGRGKKPRPGLLKEILVGDYHPRP